MIRRCPTLMMMAPVIALTAACSDVTAPLSPADLTPAEARQLAYQMPVASIDMLGAREGILGSVASLGSRSLSTAAAGAFCGHRVDESRTLSAGLGNRRG